MTWAPVVLQPGLNVELTDTDNRGAYTSTNLGRFKAGRFQKLGGWERFLGSSLSGIPRASHAWQDLAGYDRLAVGTSTSLVDITDGSIRNVTPQTLISVPTVSFTTTAGSNIVTITDTNVTTITQYDAIYLNAPIAIDGLVLSGLYAVSEYVSAGVYRILAGGNALAGVTAGGAVPAFTMTSGSANVSVLFAAHNLAVGDNVVFPNPATGGGITIQGKYVVQSVTDANNFIISAKNSATSTPGAAVNESFSITYYISIGPIAVGSAYGTGVYGAGAYGVGVTSTADTGTDIEANDWSLSNWGELLISNPENGGIYYWGPNSGVQNSMVITQAPPFNIGSFIANAQQMIIAYGSTVKTAIGVYQDPLMVKWCDVEDFTTWDATAANQAGSFRIPTGSYCVGGAATPHRSVIWTDQGIWSMDYIGASLVFGFTELATGCGLIAKHAHAQIGDTVFWMTKSNFYSLSGGTVTPMPCSVWDAVFQNLDLNRASLCHAGVNSDFNEVWFFYCAKADEMHYLTDELVNYIVDENGNYFVDIALGSADRYVKFNTVDGLWDMGTLQRNTWVDRSVVGAPIATDDTGAVFEHEKGYDADGHPLNASFDTAWIYIGEGEDVSFIDRIYPDFKWGEYAGSDTASISVTVYSVQYPGDTPQVHGPYIVTKSNQFISARIRARQFKLKVESTDMGSFWRLGHLRVRFSRDGRGM
jgi:hypothetical protein